MKKKMKKKISVALLLSFFVFVFFTNSANTYAASADGAQIVQKAREYIGKVPYVWGGNVIDGTNPGADCSGFICCIYDKFGYNLWPNRTALRNCGTNLGTDLSCAQLGDIIWFEGHVGIYSGVNSNGQHMVVHETGGNIDNVIESPISWVNAELLGIIRIPGVTVTTIVIENGVLTDYTGMDSVVVIPNSVTSIGVTAFSECRSLTSVEIPNSVTSIGQAAFRNCTSLTSVEIPNSVTEIGFWAFENCSSLISVEIPNSITEIGFAVFDSCSSLTSVEIPNSVTKIGYSAFSACSSLTSVEIPNSVTEIEDDAFRSCSSLTSVEIPNSVTSIGSCAFESCSSLTSVEIPNSVTSIGNCAFINCSGLISVEIPNSVTEIGGYVFESCSSLTSVEIPNSVTKIWNGAFINCSSLTSVEIPNSVTEIADSAFENCSNLTIYGYANSYAQSYANEKNIPFVELKTEETPVENPFTDIWEGAYYYTPVLWALENGITAGIDSTHFAPEQSCTRGQVVTFLWRAMGEPEPTMISNPFVDVYSNAYYYKAVLWALENGITAGVDATHFAPDTTVTRGQFVTFLHRAENKPSYSVSNPFIDVPNTYYYGAVLWAYENGVTAGTDSTHFSPEDSCTRGQVVTFLYRALNDK